MKRGEGFPLERYCEGRVGGGAFDGYCEEGGTFSLFGARDRMSARTSVAASKWPSRM